MSEEELRILKMIEDKKINAEDGAKLLNALNEAARARERAHQEAGRARREGRGWAWGGPEPPVPPIPPVPPLPPFDPFEAASGRGWGRERERERDRKRGRRDTEPLESESRRSGGQRFFRIRVSDPKSNNTMVNINLPVGLINFGLKVASRYIPEEANIDLDAITQAVQQGALGTILDIRDGTPENPGARVEITID